MVKRILVTGSSRGIGKAVALKLAESGHDITVHCRSGREAADDVAETIRGMGREANVLQFDVSERKAVTETIEADMEANGVYYGVVCNAGITRDNAFPAMTDDEWDSVIHTNLDGLYNILKSIVMPMVRERKGGRIVTLSSISGLAGNRGQVNYSASKAGIIGATKSLALELGKRRITVNCVAPGVIETDMIEEAFEKEVKAMIPLRRFGKAEEVANLVDFLVSDGAAYITRQVISVNGGML